MDARIGEFTDRIGDAYREQEARFSGLVEEAKDSAASAAGAVKDAAAEVADAASDAVKTTD